METGEAHDLAAFLRSVKSRTSLSYAALAGRSQVSGSSLQRYCAGVKVPSDYGVVYRFARACGATPRELRELHRLWALADAHRRGPPQPPSGAEPAAPGRIAADRDGSPYRGLSAFTEADAGLFFGREVATKQVLQRVTRCAAGPGLLVVSGASGVGKSSLLRAGMVAGVREAGLPGLAGAARWPCVVFAPGHAPLDEIALRVASLAGISVLAARQVLGNDPVNFALAARQALLAQPAAGQAGSGQGQEVSRVLLVVDQFEQVFTLCPDEGQRQAFITALHAAATVGQGPGQVPAAVVVLGVRADFEARCAGYPQLAEAVQDRYLVTPMTGRQLRMAITGPARAAGSSAEADLVETLLDEISTRHGALTGDGAGAGPGAGALPLLSHALDQAWRHRRGHTLTLSDYERTGGIEGAVAASAQRAYEQLTAAQQATACQVFTRLAATTSDGTDVAEPARRTDLTSGKDAQATRDVEAVLEAFAAERPLTLTADSVEISHEALLTAWPLLRDDWLATAHGDRITHTRLRATAAEWERQGRDPSYLYQGALLHTAAQTAERVLARPARHPPLTPTEQAFLAASSRAGQRRTRRRQALTAALTALVMCTAATAAVAAHASRQATYQRDAAISSQLINESQAIGDANGVVARLLSIAAWRFDPSPQAAYAMVTAAALPAIATLTGSPPSPVHAMAFSPDGKTLATGHADGLVRLWNTSTHELAGPPLNAHDGPVGALAFSPGGTTLAVTANSAVHLWDLATHRQTATLGPSHPKAPDRALWVSFSLDGHRLATGTDDGTVRAWDTTTHRPAGPPLSVRCGSAGCFLPFSAAPVSPDGDTLAVPGFKTVRLWDLARRRRTGTIRTGSVLNPIAFGRGGKILAVGGFDGTVGLWDVAAHRRTSALKPGGGTVLAVAISPDGETLAETDGLALRLWDLPTHRQIGGPINVADTGVPVIAFSPDSKTLAFGSAHGTAQLWDMGELRRSSRPLITQSSGGGSGALSPDGKIRASSDPGGTVELWDEATHQKTATIVTGDKSPGFDSVAFSPDGKTLSIRDNDTGAIGLWNVATRRLAGTITTGQGGPSGSIAFCPGGKTLATTNDDGTVRLWDVATHQHVTGPRTAAGNAAGPLALCPDGRTLATTNHDGTIGLEDTAHLGGVLSQLCTAAGRSLTRAEWKQYVPPGSAYRNLCP